MNTTINYLSNIITDDENKLQPHFQDSNQEQTSSDSKSGGNTDSKSGDDTSTLLGGVDTGHSLMGIEGIDTAFYNNHAFGDVEIGPHISFNDDQEENFPFSNIITFEGGSDTTTDVERLSFTDKKVAIDLGITENTGAALAVLYAAFDDIPDEDTLGFWISEADKITSDSKIGDSKTETLADAMINYYAPSGVSNELLVNLLFSNIVGEEPAPEDLSFFVQSIELGTFTQASFLAMAAETDLNQEQYAELIGQGLAYTEHESKAG